MQFSKALTYAILSLASAAPAAELIQRAESSDPIAEGAHGAFNNAAQVQDTLTHQLKSNDGHHTADVLNAFITGADSQIDNLAGFLGKALSPVTLGASQEVANMALGPFFQSATNGAEVLLSNIAGAPFDFVSTRLGNYVKNLEKVSAAAKANKLDTTKLDQLTAQINDKIKEASHKSK